MSNRSKAFKLTIFSAAAVLFMSCTTQYRNHGYVPTTEELEEISLGVDTRDAIAETIGSPSAGGVLKDGDYYYVRTRIRHYGAREPKVVERQIVAINFDKNGIARNVVQYALEDGKAVPLVRRVTDNGLGDISFLQQLAGNIGNFDASTFSGGGPL
ncbi:outer membrane protein assembly factor BamE [Pseudopelagicola sp. nBUS_19]|uniref:outer membrane protein assembly factor BamE n=1 Tax=Pseudopelagicola sp. nBUS_19 TaxID=3395316 RepID=UPI003EBA9E0F